jgi:hypothetical protein
MRTDISRQKATAEKMSRAAKVQMRFSSGPRMNELRTVQEAILLANSLDRQLKDAMRSEGLKPEDSSVIIAYMTPDLSMLFTEPYVSGKEREIQAKLAEQCCIMVGLIFGVRDREEKDPDTWILGAKPFLSTKLVLTALSERLHSSIQGIN